MLYQICISLYTPQICTPSCPLLLLLTNNLGQQNRGINRVAKVPSLIPPRKMHAFNLLCFVKIVSFFFFKFRERDNAATTTCLILVHPRSFTVQQYNQ